jgi:hypothetical protein
LKNFNPLIKKYEDKTFIITPPETRSPGLITYSSSDNSVATISGTTVNIVGLGTCVITASQIGTPKYYPGSITATLTINRNDSFSIHYPSNMIFSTTTTNRYKLSKRGLINAGENIVYRASKQMPNGIIFDKTTGEIYGKPLTRFGEFTFVVYTDTYHYTAIREYATIYCNT